MNKTNRTGRYNDERIYKNGLLFNKKTQNDKINMTFKVNIRNSMHKNTEHRHVQRKYKTTTEA